MRPLHPDGLALARAPRARLRAGARPVLVASPGGVAMTRGDGTAPPTRTCANPKCGRSFVPTRAGNVFCGHRCTDAQQQMRERYKTGKTTPRERTLTALAALGGRASWTVLMGKSGCSDARLLGLCKRLVSEGIVEWSTYEVPIRERKVVLR